MGQQHKRPNHIPIISMMNKRTKKRLKRNAPTWRERNKNALCYFFAFGFTFVSIFCIYLLLTGIADCQGRI